MANKKQTSAITKMPTQKQLEKIKTNDSGFTTASNNAVDYLETRKQAVYKIAKRYHLDSDELFQEGYEVLLTCLRDYTPVLEKANGSFITVMFNTFFGNRIENRAMEMRNNNPEYQARQAFTEKMNDGEKAQFKEDPPLLVQHLDQESPMQETLASEASMARAGGNKELALKIMRDSFFEQKLNELVAKETDDKKKAALLHVKVGGVYNFQEIAYHFGVTDSRASQVMNDLMDAFYIQRIIDSDLSNVLKDFIRLKFNEKRTNRLILEALENSDKARSKDILAVFSKQYPSIIDSYKELQEKLSKAEQKPELIKTSKPKLRPIIHSYEDVFTPEENEKYPLIGVELRKINDLKHLPPMEFHTPESEEDFNEFAPTLLENESTYPAIITDTGIVLDGERRLLAAKKAGSSEYLCIVRHVAKETDQKVLRIALNIRDRKPNKVELYYAIGALTDLGFSQQKTAEFIGTSRTNVLVYAKIREKATTKIRGLFEDGLIQVTNASSCTELNEESQDKVAKFIRNHGISWSKGAKFNDLHLSALEGNLDEFIARTDSANKPQEDSKPKEKDIRQTVAEANASSSIIQSLQTRITTYEQNLNDAEIWGARRESVINNQSEEIQQLKTENEQIKKEINAADLMRFSDPKVIENELKQLKAFYSISERISGASTSLKGASTELKRLDIRRKQVLELTTLIEDTEQHLNKLRVELLNKKNGNK